MFYDEKNRFSKYEPELKKICKNHFGFTWDDDDNPIPETKNTEPLIIGLRDIQRASEGMFLTQWVHELGGQESLHYRLHDYIYTSWGIHTASMNCHALLMFADEFAMNFKDILELVNKHEDFHLTEKQLAQKKQEQDLELNRILDEEKKKLDGWGYRFRKRFNEWARNNWYFRLKGIREMPPTVLRTKNDIWIDKTIESINKGTHHLQTPHVAEYNTLKFNELQKTLHPKTAPKLKEILIQDYFELQKELGIPFEDESSTSGHKPNQGVIRKQLEVGGIAHIWHNYGLLASKHIHKSDADWTAEEVYAYGGAGFHTDGTEEEEYFIFVSALKRLKNITNDDVKVFTLLIHLYQEFSNDEEWKNRWDAFCGLEPEFVYERFAPGFFAQRLLTNEFEPPTIWGNMAYNYNRLDTLEEYEEKSATMVLGFDQYIRDKHFHIDI